MIFVFPLRISAFMVCCLLLVNTSYASQPSVVDDAGNIVTLKQPAQRIISLSPHVTELLYAAGAGDRIVGTVEFSDFPEAAKKLPRIGSNSAFDLETMLAMQPDLVVAWESANPKALLEKLQTLSIPIFYSEPRLLKDVASNLEHLGVLAGTEDIANVASAKFRQQLAEIQKKYSSRDQVYVFYQIWHQPLMTINGEHIISQVIELCGGVNVFSGLPTLAPKISLESVLHRDPEVIVVGSSAVNHPGWKEDWYRWPDMRAVKNNHLFYIDPDLIQRQTPRILQGAAELCRQLEQVREARKAAQ